jgi:ribosomal protein S6--L-glutamate ligase
VIGVIKRKASKEDFRANVHKGGIACCVDIPKEVKELAIKATSVLGLDFAGVDFLMTKESPLILEVNSTPGFKGMEEATGKNIAGELVLHFLKRINPNVGSLLKVER